MNPVNSQLPDEELDPKDTAALVDRLRLAGHDVRQDQSGGFLVSRWGMSRHCLDAESLFAFAKQIGVTL